MPGTNPLKAAARAGYLIPVFVSVALSAASTRPPSGNDWLIVPGERAGPITSATTRADLAALFGTSNVADEDVTLSDAGPEPGTTVLAGRPDWSLIVTWNADKPVPHVDAVVFCPFTTAATMACRWHTAEGITLGTSLKTLEAANGRSFHISGFGWDYGGTVLSWRGGKFEKWREPCSKLIIRLEPGPAEPSEERTTSLDQVDADHEFSSAEPAMRALSPQVSSIVLTFHPCAAELKPDAVR